jgi:hypothetical protein
VRIDFLPGLVLLLFVQDVSAQATVQPTRVVGGIERREMVAMQMGTEDSIRLDGVLDESIWQAAIPASDFRQQDPQNGAPATEPTEVRIAYSRDALYMGVTCYDSEPDRWLGFQRGRDGFLGSDDRFMWTIDTFLDGRTAYFFEMNPSGLMADALQGSADVSNRQWDGIWNARVNRSDIGWTIEVEIPFRTLNFSPTSDAWGVNFQRTVRRKNEETLWMGWARNQGVRRMTNAGLLTGLKTAEVTQGHGLDIKPYVVGEASRDWRMPGQDGSTRRDADVGVDLFYNLTPSLRANVTVNTDFAQAEVDQRQTNLTRFSLFFPEKRDFFLDGSLFFDFADGGSGGGGGGGPPVDVAPFFSRRIGLDERGTPQAINFGSKLTGQAGAFDIGVLHVQTREEPAAAGEDFSVMRLKRRFLQQSYVGAIYTRRAARSGNVADRHTGGVDFELATSTFLGKENLIANGFLAKAPAAGAAGNDLAIGLQLEYPNDPLEAQIEYREVQRNYDAAIGFTRRTGFRQYNPRVFYSWRPDHPRIRQVNFGVGGDFFVDPDTNDALDNQVEVKLVEIQTHSQDSLEVQVVPTYERLVEDFRISPRITLPVGTEYRFTRYSVQMRTAGRRLLSVNPEVEWGDFYSGHRVRLTMTSNVRPMPGVLFSVATEWNKVQLAEGRFYTRLYRGVSELQFSPFMAWVNNIQYDTQSAILGWQSRYRWIVRPGNDIYFVYNHNWLDDPLASRKFRSIDNRLSSKLLYTYRF